MNKKALAIGGLSLIGCFAANAEASRSSLQTAISQVLKAQFSYDESKREDPTANDASAAKGDAVVLPTIFVTGRRDNSADAIAADQKKTADAKFDWRNGGTILKNEGKHITSELRFSDNPGGGVEFLKFGW